MSDGKVSLIRRNIEINSERATRQHAQENHEPYNPKVKDFFKKQFENAEYERERKENSKRGVR